MATFISLPNEILILFAFALPCPHLDWSLAALALTNRQLHRLFNPVLYGHNKDRHKSKAVEWAAKHGRIETLEKAHFFNLRLSYRESVLCSNLYTAVARKQEAAVVWLLDHGVGADMKSKISSAGEAEMKSCPLLKAIQSRQVSVARLLIDRGACLMFNGPIDRGGPSTTISALHAASHAGLVSIVRYLVQHKAFDINATSSTGEICLHYTIRGEGDWTVVEELIQLGADVNWHRGTSSPLCYAIKYGKFNLALRLIDAGSRINFLLDSRWSAIHMCTWKASPRFWLAGQLDAQQQSDKDTLLQRLIDLGADVNGSDLENQALTPFGAACLHGTVKEMTILLEAGADMDRDIGTGHRPIDTVRAMRLGSRDDRTDEFSEELRQKTILLMGHNTRLNSRFRPSGPLLEHELIWCANNNDELLLDFLLSFATKKNIPTGYLDHLLTLVIDKKFYQCSKVLLGYGARMKCSADSITSWVEEALQVRAHEDSDAFYYRFSDCPDIESLMTMLLSFNLGFDIENGLFKMALKFRDKEAVDIFLSRGMTGRYGGRYDPNEWLQEAASWGHLGVLRRLLQGLPNINGIDNENELPLSRAIQAGHQEAAMLLMEYGADAYKTETVHTGQGVTQTLKPIQHAIRHGDVEMLIELIGEQPGTLSEEEAWIPAVLASAPETAQIVGVQLLSLST
ncbi:ankyrin repeat-containing domain protein [Annulohypoxylon bovei var. microspora]|nr:ankyrin repeat-containing domain protein [Annulohypoxylon bovei var. microspora]